MINPYAYTFMIATRTEDRTFWENPHFSNRRDRGPAPRLRAAPSGKTARSRFSLFRRRRSADPADL